MWTDESGRDWSTALNVSVIRRVQDRTGILLTDAADTDLVERLYNDVIMLCNVLYAVSVPQAKERDIDAESFGELLAGDTIDKACESLMQGIVDFFRPGRRQAVTKIWTAAKMIEQERIKLLDEKLTDETLESLIKKKMNEASNEIDKRLAALGDDFGKSLE